MSERTWATGERANGPGASSAPVAGGAIFLLAVGLPSAVKVARYLGSLGAALYLVALIAVVMAAVRLGVARWIASIRPRSANALMVGTLVVLALAFVVVYPRVTSGSDRDEALDLATRQLLQGRFPYGERVFATGAIHVPGGGNPISPMPGELLLAAPFVLLGSGAWQTFFWLAAFFYLAAGLLGSRGRALLALWSMLLLGPAAVHEILTGGDLLANSLWVLVLGALVVRAPGGWTAMASAILFGIGLSSRAHFALLLPIVLVAVGRRWGWQAAVGRCALSVAACVTVTLPFYLHQPAEFSPLHIVGKLAALEPGAPQAVIAASVLGAAAATGALARCRATRDGWTLAASALVLMVPVVVAAVLAWGREGSAGFVEYGWYALSSMPFGVLATFALVGVNGSR